LGVEERGDRFLELEVAYRDYTVYDQHYEKVGKVDDLFVDENDQPEYIGVKTGLLGMKSTLIPMELIRVNDRRKLIEVAADKDMIRSGPAFDDDEEITPEHESRIHGYYGLEHPGFEQERGGYGDYYPSHTDEDLAGSVDTEYGERREEPLERPTGSAFSSETDQDYSGTSAGGTEPGSGPDSTGETRWIEEDQQTGAGEPETAGVRVRKRVRINR
jgi:PRC-barrel domain protein